MFTTVYNWLIKGYGALAQLAALRNEKAHLFVEGRRNGWVPITHFVQKLPIALLFGSIAPPWASSSRLGP